MPHRLPPRPLLAVAIGALLSAGLGCGGDGSSSPTGGEQQLRPGATVVRTVPGDSGALDSIRLSLPLDSGSMCRILFEGLGDAEDVLVRDPQGHPVYIVHLPPDTAGRPGIEFPVLSDGDHLLVVRAAGGTRIEATAILRPGLPSTVVVPDSLEPDDTLPRAHLLRLEDGWVRRTLHTAGIPDQDWMRIALDSGYTYTFETKDSMRLYASTLALFDAHGNARSDGMSMSSASWPAFGRDTVLVRVSAVDGGGVRYRIRTTRSAGLPAGSFSPDRWESDDLSTTAKSLADDSVVQERTLHGWKATHDTDWISLAVDSGRTYALHLRGSLSDLDAQLLAPDSSRLALARTTRTVSGEAVAIDSFRSVSRDRILLRIAGTSPARYALAVTSRPGIDPWYAPDIGEPDRDSLHAYLLEDSVPVRRFIQGNDTDWIRIPTAANTIYEITVENLDSTHSFGIRRFSPDSGPSDSGAIPLRGTWIRRVFPGGPGAMLLRVVPRDTAPAKVRYQVKVRPIAVPADSREPDNSRAEAIRLSVESDTLVRFVHARDVDWIRIDMDSGAPVFVTRDSRQPPGVPSDYGSLRFEILGPDSVPIQESYDDQTRRYYIETRTAGPVYLRVASTTSLPAYYRVDLTAPVRDTLEALDPQTLPLDSTPRHALLRHGETSGDRFLFPVQAGKLYGWSITCSSGTSYRIARPGAAIESQSGGGARGSFFATKDSVVTIDVFRNPYAKGLDPHLVVARAWLYPQDPDEPNNNLDSTRFLPVDGVFRSRTVAPGDSDFYVMVLDTGKTYRITVVPEENVKLRVGSRQEYREWWQSERGAVRGDTFQFVFNDGQLSSKLTNGTHAFPRDSLVIRVASNLPWSSSSSQVIGYDIRIEEFPDDEYETSHNTNRSESGLFYDDDPEPEVHTLPPEDIDEIVVQTETWNSRFTLTLDSDWPVEIEGTQRARWGNEGYGETRIIPKDSARTVGSITTLTLESGERSDIYVFRITPAPGGPALVHYTATFRKEP